MTYKHAVQIGEKCDNTKWPDATITSNPKMNMGHLKTEDIRSTPKGLQKNHVHLVLDVKHDGRCHACLVADGHLTDIPLKMFILVLLVSGA